ncbi:hypothetical protein MAN88_06100 [Microcystis aeruginosa]|nr:hypothetical protein MAN88_06100 [Microcystis aeruginosa]
MGFRQKAKVKREEKYVYLTSLGNAIIGTTVRQYYHLSLASFNP